MKKKAILSISFGTNDPETSKKNLDVLEADYKAAHEKCELYRALTNEALIEAKKEEGDTGIYAVREIMARMLLDGVTHLYVQPAYLLNGTESEAMYDMVKSHAVDFVEVKIGTPLLTTHEDIEQVCEALMEDYRDISDEDAVVFIGHGSVHYSNTVYCAIDYVFKDLGYKNAHVGTFNAFPKIDTIINHLKENGIKNVHIAPFMFVAGKVAMEGVCGDGPDSMKSRLEAEGFNVIPHRKCLGEYAGVRKVYCDHLNKCFED